MNRRSFIKNTALAATLVGVAPSAMASELKSGKKKKVIFVFRGVSYSDAENAFKKFNSPDNNIHLQKVICENGSFSHWEGFSRIFEGNNLSLQITETHQSDRYKITEVVEDGMKISATMRYIHVHHTEIGHSSNQLYTQVLEDFFAELSKHYDPKLHKIIVTADIGRNEKLNSCGGKDHSNATCLETFALFIGGKASKLKSNTNPIPQNQILQQKF